MRKRGFRGLGIRSGSMTDDFDLVAASLRADAADSRGLAEALAVRLESALPSQTRVHRRARKFLSRDKGVPAIEGHAGENRYAPTGDGHGRAPAPPPPRPP